MAAHSEHPSMHEASVLVGAAIAYTLDNWDEFITEFAKETGDNFPMAMDEIKGIYEHLLKDVGDMLDNEARMTMALDLAAQWLKNMR